MPNVIVSALNLLQVYVDLSQGQCLNDLSGSAPKGQFIFTRGDTLKGTLYAVWPTGLTSPLWYQFNIPAYDLALTDGAGIVYCTATGWEAFGGTTNPRMAFDLEVMSGALDTALRASGGGGIQATMEIHINGLAQIEGSAFPQDQYVVRQLASIQVTALNPVPPVLPT